MRSNTECVAGKTLEAAQGTEDSADIGKVGDPYLATTEEEIEVAALTSLETHDGTKHDSPGVVSEDSTQKMEVLSCGCKVEVESGPFPDRTYPRCEHEQPNWVSKWRWRPEDGLDWPKHGTDVY